MKDTVFEILENVHLTESVMKMRLSGDTSEITRAGQFVNIALDGFYLRRPISVCDRVEGELTLLYKIVGHGTEAMAKLPVGAKLNILTGLGNGYDTDRVKNDALLVGGGVGVPPLYMLARELIEKGKRVHVILGFNTASEVFYEDEFRALGASVTVTTVDGTRGTRGFVTNALDGVAYDYFYTCGPLPMLRALYGATNTSGQFSFEERMGCGFGACMGCSCKTLYGNKRICKDGPVLVKEEIIWEN